MNEQEIRLIVRDEIARQKEKSQLGLSRVPPHRHDKVDNIQIRQDDILPSLRSSGSITFSHIGTYILTLPANANPTLMLCYGIVVDSASSPTFRAFTFGSAQIGPSYYLQPSTTSSVVSGGPIQPFIQSSAYTSTKTDLTYHALTDEGHLVDVEFGGAIHARMTLQAVNKQNGTVSISVDNLDSGWSIIVNIVTI